MNGLTGMGIITAIMGTTMPYQSTGWTIAMILAGGLGAVGIARERRLERERGGR